MKNAQCTKVKERWGKLLVVLVHIFTWIAVQSTMWVQLYEERFPKYWIDICTVIGYILLDFILSTLIIRLWIQPRSSAKWAKMHVGVELIASLGASIAFFKFIGGKPIELMLLRTVFLETLGILLLERGIVILYQEICFARYVPQAHPICIQEKALYLVGMLISLTLIIFPFSG